MGNHHAQTVPRGALVGAAVLLLATLGLAAEARHSRASSEAPTVAIAASRDLRFEDQPNGAVAILDADTGREVGRVNPEEGGFVRGVMRGLFRTRKLESIDPQACFRLIRRSDGGLFIEDPQSGHTVDLRSFGDTNHASFARLLDSGVAS